MSPPLFAGRRLARLKNFSLPHNDTQQQLKTVIPNTEKTLYDSHYIRQAI
jgi:hypothetical protein